MNKSENISELVEAVTKVMSQVRGMEKNSKVGTGRSAYDGTKDQDVKEAFNSALSENGLVMMPVKVTPTVRVDRFEALDYNKNKVQKQSVFTEVACEYILAHTSGQYMQIAGYGHGVDPQDKGAGKATTYALKNALLYTFLTPVGKIDDTDTTHSNDIAPPPSKQKKAPETKPKQTKTEAIELLAAAEDFSKLVGAWNKVSKENKKNEDVLGFKETRKKELEQ
ncbi:MAG: hypothetical protein GY810_00715 [Aureispira sp.]|nr:hypothetical protein [Aureispira sp.]